MKTTRENFDDQLIHPVAGRDKFKFYEQIYAKEKERNALVKKWNELNEFIKKNQQAIENIRKEYYAHLNDKEKFESWSSKKKSEIDSLIEKRKELEEQAQIKKNRETLSKLYSRLDTLMQQHKQAESENRQLQDKLDELTKTDYLAALNNLTQMRNIWRSYNAGFLKSLDYFSTAHSSIIVQSKGMSSIESSKKITESFTNENELIQTLLKSLQHSKMENLFTQNESDIRLAIKENKERIASTETLIQLKTAHLANNEYKKNNLLEQIKKIESDQVQFKKETNDEILSLTNFINRIEEEVQANKQKVQTASTVLAEESQRLESQLKDLKTEEAKYIANIKKIDLELEKPVSFTAAQYLVEKDIKDILFKQLPIQLSAQQAESMASSLIKNCDWKKISNINSIQGLSSILMSFFHDCIKSNTHINENQYNILFNEFLIEKAISIENPIPKNKIAKMRVSDSLARCLYIISQACIGKNMAVALVGKTIKIAVNESESMDAAKQRIAIKEGTECLANIMTNCPLELDGQRKYLETCIKKYFPDQKNTDRLYSDLLNIIHFHQHLTPSHKSLIKKLEKIADEDIYVSNGIYLGEIKKTFYLHADLLLLEELALNHLLDCVKAGKEITMFPKNKTIVLGMNILSDAHSYMLINAFNKNAANILTTGTSHISSFKDTTITFVCRKFLDRIQCRLEKEKKQKIFSADYKKLLEFLTNNATLLLDSLKDLRILPLLHFSLFKNTKEYTNDSDRSPRDIVGMVENKDNRELKKFKN